MLVVAIDNLSIGIKSSFMIFFLCVGFEKKGEIRFIKSCY